MVVEKVFKMNLNLFKLLFFGILVLSSLIANSVFAQGCSDAGFCTMGAMRPNQHYNHGVFKRLKSVEVSGYQGVTKFGDYVNSLTTDLNFSITDKWAGQIKCPYFYVDGPLGKTNGVGDISISTTRFITQIKSFNLNISVGTKIPTNNANNTNQNGLPLPMYYQSSLGTYDVIAGLSMMNANWLIAVGYQQALNANGNEFLWGKWTNSEQFSIANQYPRAKDLKRGTDVMFRLERNLRFSRFNAYVGTLFIQRIVADKFTHPVFGENYQDNDSKGLALTLLAGMGYQFSVKSAVKLMYGHALVQRKVNLDGLSRDRVFTLAYELKF